MDRQLQQFISQALDRPAAEIQLHLRPSLDHQKNQLYDLYVNDRRLIAKVYQQSDRLLIAPEREYAALALVAPLEIAPQPVFFDPALAPMVIYEYLDGTMWDRRKPSPTELSQLATMWATLHALPTEGLWLARGTERSFTEAYQRMRQHFLGYADWSKAHFPPGRQTAERCLDSMEQRRELLASLETDTRAHRFCRSDPRFANVITRPDGRLGMIDWEDSGLRDPARELADLLMHANQEDLLTWGEWQVFVQPYLAARQEADPELWARTELYLAAFAFYWLMLLTQQGMQASAQGRLDSWMVNGLPGRVRLRRYMARMLAWPAFDTEPWADEAAGVPFFPD